MRGRLLHVNAATHVDGLASDVVGIRRSQEADEIGNVFWLFLTPEGNCLDHRLQSGPLFPAHRFGTDRVDVVPHSGVDDARAIGIDGDAVRGEFLGHALGHSNHGELAGGIGKLVRAATAAADRGRIDDLASSLRNHLATRFTATHEDAANVNVDDTIEVFQSSVKKGANVYDASVGDEYVKTAELTDDIGNYTADGVFVRDITGNRQGAAASGVYRLPDGVQRFSIDIVYGNGEAVGGETQGDSAANAPAGTGDPRDGSLLVGHSASSGDGRSTSASVWNLPATATTIPA